jgi:hypothetical protein
MMSTYRWRGGRGTNISHVIHVVTNWKVLEGGREGRNRTRALTNVRRKRVGARDIGRLASSSNWNGNCICMH